MTQSLCAPNHWTCDMILEAWDFTFSHYRKTCARNKDEQSKTVNFPPLIFFPLLELKLTLKFLNARGKDDIIQYQE